MADESIDNLTGDDEIIARYLETGDDTLLDALPDAERDDVRAIRALLDDDALWGEPADDLAQRIDTEVRATSQIAPARTATEPDAPAGSNGSAAAAVSTVADRPVVSDLAAARQRRSASTNLFIGIAAGMVLALGGVAVFSRSSSDEGRTAAVTATDLGAGISGSARIVDRAAGVEIVLDLDGLDRAPEGFFYQGWVKGDKGLVTIGTFHTGGHVVLWSGVDPADYPTITVTLEPEDGDPASSGQVLLRVDPS